MQGAKGYIHYETFVLLKYAIWYYILFMGIFISKGVKIFMAMLSTNFGIVAASEERGKGTGLGENVSQKIFDRVLQKIFCNILFQKNQM